MENRDWGASNWTPNTKFGGSSLLDVIKPLPPKVKQAFYAAANKGIVQQGTWSGCAFNAGSIEAGAEKGVRDSLSAAKFFEISPGLVDRFIAVWDSLSERGQDATDLLKETILQIGLFTEPGETKSKRILRQTIYKSQETLLKQQFDDLVASVDMDDCDDSLVQDIQAANSLLISA